MKSRRLVITTTDPVYDVYKKAATLEGFQSVSPWAQAVLNERVSQLMDVPNIGAVKKTILRKKEEDQK